MRKILDRRIRALIEHGISQNHRSIFVLCGDRAKDQVVILHYMLAKAFLDRRPRVLWCYDKQLGFSTHRLKRMRRIQKRLKTVGNVANETSENDPFHLFVASTQIRWCYYRETERILGQTFEFLVLQDFEAISANLLARTVETVSGGGVCVLILPSPESAMDKNAFAESRFKRRLIASLKKTDDCVMFLMDSLDPVPSTPNLKLRTHPTTKFSVSLDGTDPKSRVFLEMCKTECQLRGLISIIDNLAQESPITAFITAARGRGKSALMGIALACCVLFDQFEIRSCRRYRKVLISAPSPYNLASFFEFFILALEKCGHLESVRDFEVIKTRPIPDLTEENLAKETPSTVTRVELKSRSIVVQYVQPQAQEFNRLMLDGLTPDIIILA